MSRFALVRVGLSIGVIVLDSIVELTERIWASWKPTSSGVLPWRSSRFWSFDQSPRAACRRASCVRASATASRSSLARWPRSREA